MIVMRYKRNSESKNWENFELKKNWETDQTWRIKAKEIEWEEKEVLCMLLL